MNHLNNLRTPPGSPTKKTVNKQAPSTEKRPRKRYGGIHIEKNVKYKGKLYELIIETGRIDPGNAPLAVRLQTNDTDINKQASPKTSPKKTNWTGTYTGSSIDHSLGYLEPGNAKLIKIYAKKTISFLKVTGNFITNPHIPSDTKANTIMKIITNKNLPLNNPSNTSLQIKGIEINNHLTRHLQNLGFDCYIGQDNEHDPNQLECIILEPSKFESKYEAAVSLNQKGNLTIRYVGEGITRLPTDTVSTVLNQINHESKENNPLNTIPRHLFKDFDL